MTHLIRIHGLTGVGERKLEQAVETLQEVGRLTKAQARAFVTTLTSRKVRSLVLEGSPIRETALRSVGQLHRSHLMADLEEPKKPASPTPEPSDEEKIWAGWNSRPVGTLADRVSALPTLLR